ncbi:MAG: GIY-YIG nuclease family protein [Candidatus Omnitrophica bacterium]|nr:GIY-YIG nuclease family protein [Candidatus Omnitrophota bacterium]
MIPRPGTGGAPARAAAYVYLLQSHEDGTCYVGWTTDPVRRLVEHNAALSAYTSRKRPWRLVGVEPHSTVAGAKAYERALKRSPRKLARFKKRLLNRAANGRPCQGVG